VQLHIKLLPAAGCRAQQGLNKEDGEQWALLAEALHDSALLHVLQPLKDSS
jgi:hypothetical protein